MVLTWAVNMITSAPGRRYTQPAMKKRSERRKHCGLAVVGLRQNQKFKQNTQCNKLSNQSKEKDIECNLRLKISTEPEETMAEVNSKAHTTLISQHWTRRYCSSFRHDVRPIKALWTDKMRIARRYKGRPNWKERQRQLEVERHAQHIGVIISSWCTVCMSNLSTIKRQSVHVAHRHRQWLTAAYRTVNCSVRQWCGPRPSVLQQDRSETNKIVLDLGLGLGLAGLVLCCETRSCHARHHNDLEEQENFSSTIYSFSILCLEHHYCGDQPLTADHVTSTSTDLMWHLTALGTRWRHFCSHRWHMQRIRDF